MGLHPWNVTYVTKLRIWDWILTYSTSLPLSEVTLSLAAYYVMPMLCLEWWRYAWNIYAPRSCHSTHEQLNLYLYEPNCTASLSPKRLAKVLLLLSILYYHAIILCYAQNINPIIIHSIRIHNNINHSNSLTTATSTIATSTTATWHWNTCGRVDNNTIFCNEIIILCIRILLNKNKY